MRALRGGLAADARDGGRRLAQLPLPGVLGRGQVQHRLEQPHAEVRLRDASANAKGEEEVMKLGSVRHLKTGFVTHIFFPGVSFVFGLTVIVAPSKFKFYFFPPQ